MVGAPLKPLTLHPFPQPYPKFYPCFKTNVHEVFLVQPLLLGPSQLYAFFQEEGCHNLLGGSMTSFVRDDLIYCINVTPHCLGLQNHAFAVSAQFQKQELIIDFLF